MLINGQRALAYITEVLEVKPIEGYDRVEHVRVGGWWVVCAKKYEFKPGDKCIYIEVDSKVPDNDERFAFLEPKHYKVKTQKMCKVYSQGLIMSLDDFPEFKDLDVNTDVTEKMHIIYYVAEDNARKAKSNSDSKYKSMASRHQKLFRKKPFRWLMRRKWGRKLLFLFFGKKKDKPKEFPDYITKTDEERVENQPWRPGDGVHYIATEKLDGTSCTYGLKRLKHGKYDFCVCSRNVRQVDENQACYHDTNIYWELEHKYNIKDKLIWYLEENKSLDWVYIQGEGVGNVQGNPYKFLNGNDLFVFNFVTSDLGRINSIEGKKLIESWGMKWVPILDKDIVLPDTMEELKLQADGYSVINNSVKREGIVYRTFDGKDSFKNVSREYLLKHS